MQQNNPTNHSHTAAKNNFLPALLFTFAVVGIFIVLYVINVHASANTKSNSVIQNNCDKQTAKNISCKEKQDDTQGGSVLLRLQHLIE